MRRKTMSSTCLNFASENLGAAISGKPAHDKSCVRVQDTERHDPGIGQEGGKETAG